MKRSSTVSVAMATFNGARFLQAQLDSIAAQPRVPDELVIGDDGSTDRTAEVVADFSRKHRIEVRFARNDVRLGSTQNFASCLQRCRGDVVLLSDQDDVWHPSRVERTLDALDQHPDAAYVFSDADLIDEQGEPIPGRLWRNVSFDEAGRRAFRQHRGAEVLLRRSVITGATMGIRRDRLAGVFPIPQGWVHDRWIGLLLEARFGAVPIAERLIRYRLHGRQQIGLERFTLRRVLELLRRGDVGALYRSEAESCLALSDRLSLLDAPTATRAAEAARRKAEWLEARTAFRSSPLARFPSLVRAVLRGDYDRYGVGKRQAAFDVASVVISRLSRSDRR